MPKYSYQESETGNTWKEIIEKENGYYGPVKIRALCPDGKYRNTSRLCLKNSSYSLTYCQVKVNGKTVSGWVTRPNEKTPEYTFHVEPWKKNSDVFNENADVFYKNYHARKYFGRL